WSSVHAHLKRSNDGITNVTPMAERVGDWGEYLTQSTDESVLKGIREHSRTGRPLGDERFMQSLTTVTGTDWRKKKPGPIRKDK
ncbi:MAG: transposase, partial [Gammaproteobacteria bacterium]